MGGNDKTQPRLAVKEGDSRSAMYEQIARIHREFVEIKWRANMAGAQLHVGGNLVVHCEEAITFLAGEVLRLTALVESMQPMQDAKPPEAEA